MDVGNINLGINIDGMHKAIANLNTTERIILSIDAKSKEMFSSKEAQAKYFKTALTNATSTNNVLGKTIGKLTSIDAIQARLTAARALSHKLINKQSMAAKESARAEAAATKIMLTRLKEESRLRRAILPGISKLKASETNLAVKAPLFDREEERAKERARLRKMSNFSQHLAREQQVKIDNIIREADAARFAAATQAGKKTLKNVKARKAAIRAELLKHSNFAKHIAKEAQVKIDNIVKKADAKRLARLKKSQERLLQAEKKAAAKSLDIHTKNKMGIREHYAKQSNFMQHVAREQQVKLNIIVSNAENKRLAASIAHNNAEVRARIKANLAVIRSDSKRVAQQLTAKATEVRSITKLTASADTAATKSLAKMNAAHGRAIEMNKKITKSRSSAAKGTITSSEALKKLTSAMNINSAAHRGWWERFGVTAIGFAVVYRAIYTVQNAISSLTRTFTAGSTKMDEYTQSLGETAGMLATLRSSGSFSDAFNQNVKAMQGTMQEIIWLAPEFGLSTEAISNGIKELAQFGVVLEETDVRPFLATLTAIEQIASTTSSSAGQVRQEIQAMFSGTKRVSDQFGRFLDKIPELREAIYGIGKEALSSQEKWAKVMLLFGTDYATAIEFANATISRQFSMIIERIGTIAMLAADNSGVWQSWVDRLRDIYKALTDINSPQFKKIYAIFYKSWVYLDRSIAAVKNFGTQVKIVYAEAATAIAPFKDLIMTIFTYYAYLTGAKVIFGMILGAFTLLVSPLTLVVGSIIKMNAAFKILATLSAGGGIWAGLTEGISPLFAKILGVAAAISAVVFGLYKLDKWTHSSESQLLIYNKLLETANSNLAASKKLVEDGGSWLLPLDVAEKRLLQNQQKVDKLKEDIEKIKSGAAVDSFSSQVDGYVKGAIEAATGFIDTLAERISSTESGAKVSEALKALFAFDTSDIGVPDPTFMRNEGNTSPVQTIDTAGVTDPYKEQYKSAIVDMYIALLDKGEIAYNKLGLIGKDFVDGFSDVWTDVWEGNITTSADLFDAMGKSMIATFRTVLADMTAAYFKIFVEQVVSATKSAESNNLWKSVLIGAIGILGGGTGGASGTLVKDSLSLKNGEGVFGSGLSSDFSLGKTTKPYAAGGIIPEPVVGIGLNSGVSYSFAEKGPERILSNQDSFKGSGSVDVSVNITNNSKSEVKSSQNAPRFDGKKMILDVILEDYMSGGSTYRAFNT